MSVLDASMQEHTLRRLNSIVHTLNTVAYSLDEVESGDVQFRWELLVAVENLIDIAGYVTSRCREISWGPEPLPFNPDTGYPDS